MSITTKLTLVVALLAGLLIAGAGYTTLVLKESRDLTVVRDHGRLIVSMLKAAAESDLRNHGQLGVVADIASQKAGQTAVFYGRDGRAIAPVPTDAEPEINLRARKVIESKQAKETVEKINKREAYVLRSPLWTRGGLVAGAVELRVDLHDALNRRSWLRPVLIIAGGLMALFVLIIALYAYRSMGPLGQGAYQRHEPQNTVLYQLVEEHLNTLLLDAQLRSEHGYGYPQFVEKTFRNYVDCGRLELGFCRVVCPSCGYERLRAFSCKCRGVCPSCDARRMNDSAAHLVDRVLPTAPYRQFVLTFPIQVRLLLLRDPKLLSFALSAHKEFSAPGEAWGGETMR
jgi:hypothetical protein